MIWLYLFLLDFLIPFLCDPDLQCISHHFFVVLVTNLVLSLWVGGGGGGGGGGN